MGASVAASWDTTINFKRVVIGTEFSAAGGVIDGGANCYDFTLFISTDDTGKPDWLPKPRLYYGLSRFGLLGAAGVIENRMQELGREPPKLAEAPNARATI